MGRARKRKQEREQVPPSPERSRARAVPSSAPSGWIFGAIAVVVLGAAVYANSFSVPFLFDDYFVIVANPETHSVEPWSRFFSRSRGIPHLLDTLNYLAGGEDVWGYHLVNLMIHLANGVLVYAIALLTLRLPIHGGRYERSATALATITALVFTVHPLQTMAVTYIVQRAESVAAMFYLLAVLLFAAGLSGRIALRGAALAGVLVAVGLIGIMSKETVASLPAALALYYACFLRGESTADGRKLAAILLLPTLYGVYLARHFLIPGLADPDGGQSAWMFIPTAGLGVEGVTPWRYLITQFGVLVWYLRLYFVPTQLCFDYGWPFASSFWSAGVLLPLLVLLSMVAVAVVAYSRYRWLTFGIAWFFITLAPSSSIIPIKDAAFEYRMYLPIFGLTLMLVVALADALQRWIADRALYQRVGTALAVVAVVLLSWGTVARNHTLRSELSLAQDSVAKAPLHWRNQYALGSALLQVGKAREAIDHFARAIELNPNHHTPRVQLGDLYSRMGRLEEAESVLLPATDAREESVSAAAYRQLGKIYKAQNYPQAAIGMYEEALARQPRWHSVGLEIARLQRHTGAWHDAAIRLNRLVAREPAYATRFAGEIAETNLGGGVMSFEQNEPEFARNMLEIAMEHPSTLPMAARYLAFVEVSTGNRARAVEILEDLTRRGLGGADAARELDQIRSGETPAPPTSTADLR